MTAGSGARPTVGRPGGGVDVVDLRGRPVLTVTTPRVLTRVAVLAPVLGMLALLQAAAPGTPWWPALPVVLLTVATAEVPDSPLGLVTLGALASWWVAAAGAAPPWSNLLFAAGAVLFHAAVAHAAAGPPGFTTERAVVARLAGRVGGTLVATAVVALAADAAAGRFSAPLLAVAAALLLAGALPWVAAGPGRAD